MRPLRRCSACQSLRGSAAGSHRGPRSSTLRRRAALSRRASMLRLEAARAVLGRGRAGCRKAPLPLQHRPVQRPKAIQILHALSGERRVTAFHPERSVCPIGRLLSIWYMASLLPRESPASQMMDPAHARTDDHDTDVRRPSHSRQVIINRAGGCHMPRLAGRDASLQNSHAGARARSPGRTTPDQHRQLE